MAAGPTKPTQPVGYSSGNTSVVVCPGCGEPRYAFRCETGVRTSCCGIVVEVAEPVATMSTLVPMARPVVEKAKKPRRKERQSTQGRRGS